jgi:hypothetical protein
VQWHGYKGVSSVEEMLFTKAFHRLEKIPVSIPEAG